MTKIRSSVTIRVNTGNYESVEFSKSMEAEFTCKSEGDLEAKQRKLDAVVLGDLMRSAEKDMSEMGRKRFHSDQQKEIGLWELWNNKQ